MKLSLILVGVLMLAGTFQARASSIFVVNMYQDGDNVVATGSGSIDLTDLSGSGSDFLEAELVPQFPVMISGPGTPVTIEYFAPFYEGPPIQGPSNFGPGVVPSSPVSGTGDMVGFDVSQIVVPFGYVSGDPLSNSMLFEDTDAEVMGITPGVYTWTWGAGADAGSLTLNAFVPEPSHYGWGLFLVFGGLFAFRRLRA